MIIALVDDAVAAGARREAACRMLDLSCRTVERWRKVPGSDQRCGPTSIAPHALSDAEREEIRRIATAPEFSGLSPHQIVAKMADMGIYVASESSFYRELRRAKLAAHRELSRPRVHRKPAERVATGPNQTWAWDITYLPGPVKGTYYYLYAILDVWSRKLVGVAVHDCQDDALAATLVEQACQREGVRRHNLLLHADNGGPMRGKTMLAKLEELGVMASFSRPRVSDDNAFAEALFRTLKYRPNYPEKRFSSLAAAVAWTESFAAWYNEDHLHSAISFVTPAQRHDGRHLRILARRHQVYIEARARHPRRWSGPTRNWKPVGSVSLHTPRSARVSRTADGRQFSKRAGSGA